MSGEAIDLVTVRVLGAAACPVSLLTGDASALVDRLCLARPEGRLLLVVDRTVANLWLGDVEEALRSRGRTFRSLIVPAGEAAKRPETLVSLWDRVFADDVDRDDAVVALGGGAAGDLAGLLASTVMRGLPVVQIPTTLLAMADAAIGGKTAVNLTAGKNLVGTFHHPQAVLGWVTALRTLPDRELRAGLAEIVKAAWIDGEDAVASLEATADALVARDTEALVGALRMAVSLKGRVVESDPTEQGARRLLNFGHTFGHAIETATGHSAWLHGEAVAAGMVCAMKFAEHLAVATAEDRSRLVSLVERLGLPTEPPTMSLDDWMRPMSRDKKRTADAVRLILAGSPGTVRERRTDLNDLASWLGTHFRSPRTSG